MFLATRKQILYLQELANRCDFIKMRHPSLMPLGLNLIDWDKEGITSDKASRCIQFYNEILRKADEILHPAKAETEDLPDFNNQYDDERTDEDLHLVCR